MKAPKRTCVGCRVEEHPREMVRVVLGPDGSVVPDLAGSAFGRGAWLHPRSECVARAAPRGFSRSFASPVTTRARDLLDSLRQAGDRRAAGLVQAARGGRKLALGSEAVRDALAHGEAHLVVVASDAQAAAKTPWVLEAVTQGRAVVWGTKSRLGKLTGRPDTGVMAILDAGLSTALSRAVFMMQIPEPVAAGPRRMDE